MHREKKVEKNVASDKASVCSKESYYCRGSGQEFLSASTIYFWPCAMT